MIIRRILLVAACLPFIVGLAGCDPFAIQGDGRVTSITRSVDAFTEVDAESSLDVEIGRAARSRSSSGSTRTSSRT